METKNTFTISCGTKAQQYTGTIANAKRLAKRSYGDCKSTVTISDTNGLVCELGAFSGRWSTAAQLASIKTVIIGNVTTTNVAPISHWGR